MKHSFSNLISALLFPLTALAKPGRGGVISPSAADGGTTALPISSGIAIASMVLFFAVQTVNAAPGVALRVKRAGAPEGAPNADAMAFMMQKPARRLHSYTLDNIVPVQSSKDSKYNWYRGGWQDPVYLAEFSGNIKIPADGDYTFEIRTFAPAYFWLDDRLVLQQETYHFHDPRKNQPPPEFTSETLKLKAGAAKLRIITMCRSRIELELLWKNPKSPKDFVSVANSDWLEAPAQHDGRETANYSFSTVSGAFCPMLGSTGEVKRVDFRRDAKPLVEYRLTADISGLPAVCDENEKISPEIQGATDAPDFVSVEFEATVISMSKGTETTNTFSSTVSFNEGWGRLELPEYSVRDIRSVKWRAAHRGITIVSGTTEFLQRPYKTVPDEIRNDALYADGKRIVPVTSRNSKEQPTSQAVAKNVAEILVVDGFITSPASGGAESGKIFDDILTNGMEIASYRRMRTSDLAPSGPVAFSSANLHSMLAAVKAQSGSTVILAPEIRGAYYGETIDDFGKKLLADVAFLRDVLNCEIILLTPPEGIIDASEPNSARDYAAVIHLAADIEGLKVIDLYTLGKTRNIQCADTVRLSMSAAGAKLAADFVKTETRAIQLK